MIVRFKEVGVDRERAETNAKCGSHCVWGPGAGAAGAGNGVWPALPVAGLGSPRLILLRRARPLSGRCAALLALNPMQAVIADDNGRA
jgi:hypothetical protein